MDLEKTLGVNMTYLSLARKYRPQDFDEVVGQEHIATTLTNAISMGRVAHAYLFSGPRGVGKTSMARILAKSLNCEKAPTSKPCGACPSCREISGGTGMDVIEIDGASNRGIDEIRNLKENIKFTAMRGKFRIYIIDEVHMLTTEAFNALLKTLEEPPLHVKFIFATTKPYKVLPTIVSRCQRFDFRKISKRGIVDKLKEIREKEKLDIDDEAIFLIAKASDGSLRDAEVILDQLLAFAKGEVRSGDVVKVLGLLEQDVLFEIVDCITNDNKEKILNLIDQLINSGKDPIFVTSNIISHMRNLLVAGTIKEEDRLRLALSEEDYRKLREQAGKFSADEILYIIYTLAQSMDLIKKTSLGRIPLEISLIKLTEKGRLDSIKVLLEKVSVLEGRLTDSGGGVEPTGAGATKTLPETAVVPKEEITVERDILLLQKIKDLWPKVLNIIKNRKMSVATFLSEGELLKVQDGVLAIGFARGDLLHKETLLENVNKKIVEETIENLLGERISLAIETVESRTEGEPPLISQEEGPAIDEELENSNKKMDPIVESALDIFEGRVLKIRDIKSGGKR
ncbi:MAG: DNA polymerase III subunit gamma/tau [Omnitrophica bacterium]|nr:DNA polymerase III subunit gamma/tau [Candidatus Omnitrophota bacterium]